MTNLIIFLIICSLLNAFVFPRLGSLIGTYDETDLVMMIFFFLLGPFGTMAHIAIVGCEIFLVVIAGIVDFFRSLNSHRPINRLCDVLVRIMGL